MTGKKRVPRDSRGILFYGLGWLIGSFAKLVWTIVRSFVYGIYTIYKRDQFNRQLRLASADAENETNIRTRKLGREKLRFLAANFGLTDAKWHIKSVKIRRRIVDAVKSAKECGFDDFTNEAAANTWDKEVTGLLFTNFDSKLLTADVAKKRRFHFRKNTKVISSEINSEKDSGEEKRSTGLNQNNFESENPETWVA